jgi:hypothetical protein
VSQTPSVRIDARGANGKLITTQVVPVAGDPMPLHNFITKQALPALQLAVQKKQQLVMIVAKPWKVWVMRYILRAHL